MAFPPIPIYPIGVDNNKTLYVVYDSSSTQLAADNATWAEELSIVPVGIDSPEQWGTNGYANISGELFYYDDVGYDVNGKIDTLKKCARNLGGEVPQFNPAGTWIRGYVIADHHNQLALTIMLIEKFIGIPCTVPCNDSTLFCRLLDVQNEPGCPDDSCPIVNFSFQTNTPSSCTGTIADYNVQIIGNFSDFRLDFGDGSFTTTDLSGQFTYSPNSTIDPVVTVTSNNCQIIQTPSVRNESAAPTTGTTIAPFEPPIPTPIEFPPITTPTISVPSINLSFPPVILPCSQIAPGVSIGNISIGNIPSIIAFQSVHIPSNIAFSPVTLSSFIAFGPAPSIGPINFGPAPSFPTLIAFGPAPSLGPINFGPAPSFPTVNFGPAPSMPSLNFGPVSIPNVSFGPSPSIEVTWGEDPDPVVCNIDVSCSSEDTLMAPPIKTDIFTDGFDSSDRAEIAVSPLNVPSQIELIVPTEMPQVKLVHSLPESIKLDTSGLQDIHLVISKEIPAEIELVSSIPNTIELISDVPHTIKLDGSGLPEAIRLLVPEDFPTSITLDASGVPDFIQVKGIPETISLISNLPEKITLRLSDESRQIELIYPGAPIPVQFDTRNLLGDNPDNLPCFALVPCNK